MEKQRIFRSRQNVTFGDLNAIQDYAARTFEDVVSDLLVSGKGYAGFLSTRDSATTVQVGAGRLYSAGRIFAHDATLSVSLSTYLPAAAQRIVTLVAYGQAIDSEIEPRDFLINVTTRATEPQSVAMVQERVAQVSVVPGSESADPQRPAIPEAYVPIADVLIGTAGIISVTMRSDFAVPELDLAKERLDGITAWQLRVGQVLDGLLSDLATLGRRVDSLPTRAEFADLAAQVSALRKALDELRRNITASIEADLSVIKAQMKAFADLVAGQITAIASNLAVVKENLDLSDLNSLYGADQFLIADESDLTASGYDALVEEGVRFPWAATALSTLQLDNPINGSVTMTPDGLMVPNYTSVDALVVGAPVANEVVQAIPVADYQFATHQLIQRSISRTRIRYGTTRTVCTNASFWSGGQYNSVTGVFTKNGETFEVRDANGNIPTAVGRNAAHAWYRVRQFWTDTFDETYWEYQPTISTIQGVQIGQTFVNGQARYCTGLSLGLTQIGPTGNVTVALCETRSDGTPNPNRVLAQSTLAQANLKRFPEWTLFPIRPTLLKQGGRYALLLITGGAHYIGTVSGSNFTSGTLFFSTDGQYLLGDLTKDIRFKVHVAKFTSTRVSVELKPLQLAGGVADIDILAPQIVPDATNLTYQVRVGDTWYSIAETTPDFLGSLPAVLPLRAVMTGTPELMPVIHATDSQVRVSRAKTAFTHVSSERTLPSGMTTKQVRVVVRLYPFVAAQHTIAVTLLTGAGYATSVTPAAVVTRNVSSSDRANDVEKEYLFTVASPIAAYKIRMAGGASSAGQLFHIEQRIDTAI
jgi:hypothetical protein